MLPGGATLPTNPLLRDIADLLVLTVKEAGTFCSEVAWHADREVTYPMIIEVLESHPHTDPSPEEVARWIMARGAEGSTKLALPAEPSDPFSPPDPSTTPVEIEFDPAKDKLNVIQKHDFRDAQAMFARCPHGVPITQRCRICRPTD
jgi:hypothetical protein